MHSRTKHFSSQAAWLDQQQLSDKPQQKVTAATPTILIVEAELSASEKNKKRPLNFCSSTWKEEKTAQHSTAHIHTRTHLSRGNKQQPELRSSSSLRTKVQWMVAQVLGRTTAKIWQKGTTDWKTTSNAQQVKWSAGQTKEHRWRLVCQPNVTRKFHTLQVESGF